MTFSLTWLPSVLEAAGLKVAEDRGWELRGRDEMGKVLGVMCHHTAGGKVGNMPSLATLRDGRSDLPGPLAQLGLGRDGTFYVIAAGKCNHAGNGVWQGIKTGNSSFIGIEAENTGGEDDKPWPDVQLIAYRHGVAAILKHIGQPALYCTGHKEYATPVGRKTDPDFDMNAFRLAVATIMDGRAPAIVMIPPVEPAAGSAGTAPRQTLRRGAFDELVMAIQRKLALPADGNYGSNTEAAVREFQRTHALVPDGIVGPKTWAALDSQ